MLAQGGKDSHWEQRKQFTHSQLAASIPYYCLFPWSVLGRHRLAKKKYYRLLPQAEGDLRNNEVTCPQSRRESVSELEDLCRKWCHSYRTPLPFKMNCARWAFHMTYYSYYALSVTTSCIFSQWG